ncbi:prepilin peptidase CpaA [Rhodovulum iodosum]|uniref:Prepilin peptidase CpaA n=1 Tax=Rhodovulum iodosum TaxID=68291 RepID=A0ABV3XW94_9RHOB|nr:prepilin peptidase [Rhodovulum robiginosum]RSK36771.1 hypothetical protein EJA01_04560 [Rhodovulum robiginosum]
MNIPASAAILFLPFVTPVALWVAWSDMKAMRIANRAVLVLVAIYAVVGPFALPLEAWAWGWAHLALVLAIGFVLNMGGLVGGGDAKFAAAMAPFIAAADARLMLVLFAAVLLAAFLTHRTARATPAIRGLVPEWESWQRRDFPMGLALGGALIFYLALAAAFGS